MTERISLEGKVAAVTGAGRGLGRAYVELLAGALIEGVWPLDRKASSGTRLAKHQPKAGHP